MKRIGWAVASFLVGVALIVAWQAVATARLVSPIFLPGPDRAWAALVHSAQMGQLWPRVFATLWHVLLGWALASVLGIVLGALIGVVPILRRLFGPSLEFLRPLPASATIPVFIALLGLTDTMVLSVIAFGAVWPMLLATMHGVAAIEPRLIEVARALRLSRLALVWRIALPSALPDIFAGLRLSLTVALILTVVCEMLSGVNGLGSWTLVSARAFRSADLYAGVIVIGLIGYISATVLSALERHLLRWRSFGR